MKTQLSLLLDLVASPKSLVSITRLCTDSVSLLEGQMHLEATGVAEQRQHGDCEQLRGRGRATRTSAAFTLCCERTRALGKGLVHIWRSHSEILSTDFTDLCVLVCV